MQNDDASRPARKRELGQTVLIDSRERTPARIRDTLTPSVDWTGHQYRAAGDILRTGSIDYNRVGRESSARERMERVQR